jgi:hypothetical protein
LEVEEEAEEAEEEEEEVAEEEEVRTFPPPPPPLRMFEAPLSTRRKPVPVPVQVPVPVLKRIQESHWVNFLLIFSEQVQHSTT